MAKADLPDHPKFLRLKHLLGLPTPHVWGHLECLWRRGYQTGNPIIGDSVDVELAAEWSGEPGAFTAAAARPEVRFLEKRNGVYIIHALYEHAPAYVQKRMQRIGTAPPEWYAQHPEVKPVERPVRQTRRNHRPDPGTAAASTPADNAALIQAIAEVTRNDPATDERRFNRACKVFNKAGYGPDDVRRFGREYHIHCPEAKNVREFPDIPELVRKIGRMRAKKKAAEAKDREIIQRRQQSQAEAAEFAAKKNVETTEFMKQRQHEDEAHQRYYESLTPEQKEELEAYILTRFKRPDREILSQPAVEWPPMLAKRYEAERAVVIRARMAG